MAEGFKIADAYVAVVTEIEKTAVDKSATEAGTRAGDVLADGMTKEMDRSLRRDSRGRFIRVGEEVGSGISGGVSKGIRRDSRGRFVKTGEGLGTELSGGLLRSLGMNVTSGLGQVLGLVGTNPYVVAGAIAAGTAIAPLLAAGLSGGLAAGGGLGVIGIGALLLKEEPALVKAATTLKDRALSIFKTAARPMLGPLINALGIFDKMLVRIGPQIGEVFAAVAPAITPLAEGLTSLVESALPGLVEFLKTSGPLLSSLGPSFTMLGEAIGTFFTLLAGTGPEGTQALQDLIWVISSAIVNTGLFVAGIAKAYTAVRGFFTSIPGWISSAWGGIKSVGSTIAGFFTDTIPGWFSSAWATVWGGISAFGSAVGGFFTDTIPGWFSSLWGQITRIGAAIGSFFAALPGQILGFLQSLPGRASALFLAVFDAVTYAVGFGIGSVVGFFAALPGRIMAFMSMIGSVVSGGWDAVVGFFAALPGRASTAISTLWTTVSTWFVQTRDRATSTASSIVTNVVNWLQQLPGRAGSAVSALWGRMAGWFSTARSSASSTASSLVSGVVNWLQQLPGRAASAVSSVAGRITGALRGAVSAASGIGRDIITGIISGIDGMLGWAVDMAKRAAGNIVSGIKDALKIGSPSRVMADQVGRWLLPGAVQGVRRSLPAARRDIGSLVRRAVEPVGAPAPVRAVPTRGGDTHYHFAPGSVTLDASKLSTIQDVIDLVGGIQRTARSFATRPVVRGRVV